MYDVREPYDRERILDEAESFVRECYTELDKEDEIEDRLAEIRADVRERGHYDHTYEELEHGAKMAWRNSNRCVGRLFWDTLEVVDERELETPGEIHEACCRHIKQGRNGGDIVPTITVFKPEIRGETPVRIWNYELLRYAGYETDDGVIGDPAETAFTDYCLSRGWEPDRTDFDILPHVIQVGDDEPSMFEVPDSVVEEVELSHPDYEWFADLGLKWYDVPIVSNMCLEIGGIRYPAAPFNGWYLSTEIGARNLTDRDRYDMLPEVARRLGLDTSKDRSLWKDEATLEIHRAVIHSFDEAGVRITDPHEVTDQFEQFERNENAEGRDITGDWSWLIPPTNPATTQTFHTSFDEEVKTPNFFYREDPDPMTE